MTNAAGRAAPKEEAMLIQGEDYELSRVLDDYDRCWQEKDLEGLRKFHSGGASELIYFDNHRGNDTWSRDEHFALLEVFFTGGKSTESGGVEPLLTEKVRHFKTDTAACVCYYARYKSFPEPAMRVTLYLEKESGNWLIRHVHCSFTP